MNNKILDNEIIKSIGETVAYLADGDLVDNAFVYLRRLEAAVKKNKAVLSRDFRIKNVYKQYILLLKYIVLPELKKEEITKIIKTSLLPSFDLPDYDLYEKIKEKAVSLNSQEEINDFIKQIQNALLVNNEMISKKEIVVNNIKLMPSIANWLKDYILVCQSEEYSPPCLEKYFFGNVNFNDLPKESSIKIKKIITVFEKLKIPIILRKKNSKNITVIMPDGDIGLYHDGRVRRISPDVKKKIEEIIYPEKRDNFNFYDSSNMVKTLGYDSKEEGYKPTKKERQIIESALTFPLKNDELNTTNDFVSLDEKKKEIINFLKNSIFTKNYSNPIIENAANLIIFDILSKDLNFKIKMEKTLYQNLQKITHKNFILDNKAKSPSIRNWLRYFIEENGSGMFNNLELTKFISESRNAKELNDKERKILSKLLRTYRNIKFFPQSMGNLPPEQWEIIPIEKKEKTRLASQFDRSLKTGREALLDQLKGNIDDYAPGSLEREILEEESDKDREYHKLLLLAKKYPEGSLERRAIEDEIAKLEK